MQSTIAHAVKNDELSVMFTEDAIKRIHEYAANIEKTFHGATPIERSSGLNWYDVARGEAARIASLTGIDLKTAAAVLAVTSPSVSWSNQCNYTLGFVQAVLAGADAGKVYAPFYGANKAKAGRILIDGDFTALRGVKVEMFFANIMGDHSVATVDRHALRIAFGRPVGVDECAALLAKSNRQRLEVVAAYHLAAKRCGYAVALVQAVTWVVFRGKAD